MAHKIEDLKDIIVATLEEKKAIDIKVADIKDPKAIARTMIFATHTSKRGVVAVAEYICLKLKHEYRLKYNIEGKGQGDWVLIDLGDLIVHIFHPDARKYYELDKLWIKDHA